MPAAAPVTTAIFPSISTAAVSLRRPLLRSAHAEGLVERRAGRFRRPAALEVAVRRVPHYVSLMRWTSKGVAGLPAWRERVEEGERIVQEAGGSLVGVYVTLGRYDVVEIFEAPDDDTAAEILMKLQRHGAEHTETLRAFTRDEAEAIIRRL
jgi:uncharacterized protein with GYD domain